MAECAGRARPGCRPPPTPPRSRRRGAARQEPEHEQGAEARRQRRADVAERQRQRHRDQQALARQPDGGRGQQRRHHDAEGVGGDQVAGLRDRSMLAGGHVGQQPEHHELAGADAEAAQREREQRRRAGVSGGRKARATPLTLALSARGPAGRWSANRPWRGSAGYVGHVNGGYRVLGRWCLRDTSGVGKRPTPRPPGGGWGVCGRDGGRRPSRLRRGVGWDVRSCVPGLGCCVLGNKPTLWTTHRSFRGTWFETLGFAAPGTTVAGSATPWSRVQVAPDRRSSAPTGRTARSGLQVQNAPRQPRGLVSPDSTAPARRTTNFDRPAANCSSSMNARSPSAPLGSSVRGSASGRRAPTASSMAGVAPPRA